jgi:hypothetical protein
MVNSSQVRLYVNMYKYLLLLYRLPMVSALGLLLDLYTLLICRVSWLEDLGDISRACKTYLSKVGNFHSMWAMQLRLAVLFRKRYTNFAKVLTALTL